ncbi:MAG: phosphatidylglycerol lysyltransferase domain-containing protein [Nitrospiria bacterium]
MFLSGISFPVFWIWKDFFDYFILREQETLFLLASYDGIWYMPVPPRGERPLSQTIPFAFSMMDRLNADPSSSRIENLSFTEVAEIVGQPFKCYLKSWDYLYERAKIIGLKGERYKEKRWGYNTFIKHQTYDYRPFTPQDMKGCQELYREWRLKKEKTPGSQEKLYALHLIEDSAVAHRRMMEEAGPLGLVARVVTIGSTIKGYIFGYRFNETPLIVLAEITDISIKGLAQFIFRRFCEEFNTCQWVNTMDDSGLSSLKRVKDSYHPAQLIPSYTFVHQ